MENLKKKLQEAYEATNEWGKFKHLFSADDGVKTLAKLHETLGQILLHAEMSDIKDIAFPKNKVIRDSEKQGTLVSIRPCGEEYKNKTYVGFYLGDIALGSSVGLSDNKIQLNFANHNPAIFVPELGKIIYGCESWWGEIESIEKLKEITNEDIDNVWYVKLLKSRLK
jgi:hypothetical protein